MGDVWAARDIIRIVAVRDFRAKFKQSLLGPAWAIIQPIGILVAFLVAYSGRSKQTIGDAPYYLFVLAGSGVWSYFQISVNMGVLSLASNYGLVTRTSCPRVALPLATLLTNLPALAAPMLASIAISVVTLGATWRLALIPAMCLWLLALTAATVLALSALAARVRDVMAMIPFVLQIGIFISPVGYAVSDLSDTARQLVELNPLTGVIEGWRYALFGSTDLTTTALAGSIGLTAGALWVAWHLFSRLEPTLADHI